MAKYCEYSVFCSSLSLSFLMTRPVASVTRPLKRVSLSFLLHEQTKEARGAPCSVRMVVTLRKCWMAWVGLSQSTSMAYSSTTAFWPWAVNKAHSRAVSVNSSLFII